MATKSSTENRTIASKSSFIPETRGYLELLQRVASTANEAASVGEAIQSALDLICELTAWPVGHFYQLDPENSDRLLPSKIWHLEDENSFRAFKKVTDRTPLARGIGLPGRVLEHGSPLWILDVTRDPNFPRAKLMARVEIRTGFAFPVFIREKIVGVLEFFSKEIEAPDPEFLRVMSQVGIQLGRVIERQITEDAREHLLARIEAERARLESIVQQMPTGLAIVDTAGELTFCNEKLKSILPEDLQQRALARIRRGEFFQREETQVQLTDGSSRMIETSSAPIYDREGRLLNQVGIVSDITEKKRKEAENSRLQAEHAKSVDLREELLHIVAHDLKNPLTVIQMSIDSLRRKQHQKGLLRIESAAAFMQRLIHDLLDFARVEAGALSLELEQHSAQEIFEEAILLIAPKAQEKQIRISTDFSESPALIECDRQRMLQVFTNLLDNAIKYSPPQTVITAKIERGKNPGAEEVVFSIRDSGPGIAAEDLERIFDRFWQVKKTGSKAGAGAGLGLAIARGIVNAHRGKLWAESKLGQGSVFCLSIPGKTS